MMPTTTPRYEPVQPAPLIQPMQQPIYTASKPPAKIKNNHDRLKEAIKSINIVVGDGRKRKKGEPKPEPVSATTPSPPPPKPPPPPLPKPPPAPRHVLPTPPPAPRHILPTPPPAPAQPSHDIAPSVKPPNVSRRLVGKQPGKLTRAEKRKVENDAIKAANTPAEAAPILLPEDTPIPKRNKVHVVKVTKKKNQRQTYYKQP